MMGAPRAGAPITLFLRMDRMIRTLLESHGMPPDEIDAVLDAEDPRVVARYLELHRERLQEQLAERLRSLDALGPLLMARAQTRCGSCRATSVTLV